MREINCERKAGCLSVWFCEFPSEASFWNYFEDIFCVEDEADYDPSYNMLEKDYNEALTSMYLPQNAHRPFEQEFRELFEDNFFNRFEYDFGVTFDQDFNVAGFCNTQTDDITTILGEWEDGSGDLTNAIRAVVGEKLPRLYNGFFAIPSCKYNGYTKSIERGGYRVDFLGVVREDSFSNENAELYNG